MFGEGKGLTMTDSAYYPVKGATSLAMCGGVSFAMPSPSRYGVSRGAKLHVKIAQ